METVDVVLSGNILPGAELAEATAQFASLTGLSQEQARELISSGRERTVKRGVSATVGQKYLDKLSSIGAEARLRSATVPAPQREQIRSLSTKLPTSSHQARPQAQALLPYRLGKLQRRQGQSAPTARPKQRRATAGTVLRVPGAVLPPRFQLPTDITGSRMPGLSSAAEKEPG